MVVPQLVSLTISKEMIQPSMLYRDMYTFSDISPRVKNGINETFMTKSFTKAMSHDAKSIMSRPVIKILNSFFFWT